LSRLAVLRSPLRRKEGGNLASERSNVDRLQDEGFSIKTPLPAEYEQVIEGLSPEELDVLVSVKQRLDEAQALTSPEVGSYTEYLLGPVF
jgi:hypothetical protein